MKLEDRSKSNCTEDKKKTPQVTIKKYSKPIFDKIKIKNRSVASVELSPSNSYKKQALSSLQNPAEKDSECSVKSSPQETKFNKKSSLSRLLTRQSFSKKLGFHKKRITYNPSKLTSTVTISNKHKGSLNNESFTRRRTLEVPPSFTELDVSTQISNLKSKTKLSLSFKTNENKHDTSIAIANNEISFEKWLKEQQKLQVLEKQMLSSIPRKDKKIEHTVYRNCFSGTDVTTWLVNEYLQPETPRINV
jgi:hypothetical protein